MKKKQKTFCSDFILQKNMVANSKSEDMVHLSESDFIVERKGINGVCVSPLRFKLVIEAKRTEQTKYFNSI